MRWGEKITFLKRILSHSFETNWYESQYVIKFTWFQIKMRQTHQLNKPKEGRKKNTVKRVFWIVRQNTFQPLNTQSIPANFFMLYAGEKIDGSEFQYDECFFFLSLSHFHSNPFLIDLNACCEIRPFFHGDTFNLQWKMAFRLWSMIMHFLGRRAADFQLPHYHAFFSPVLFFPCSFLFRHQIIFRYETSSTVHI